MDLERLPSRKFATDALMVPIVLWVFSLPCVIGKVTPDHSAVPLRTSGVDRWPKAIDT